MSAIPAPLIQFEFLDNEQTATALHATRRQIERWTYEGRLGHVRLGNKTLHTPEQIAAFVESCTIDAAAGRDGNA